MSGRRGAAADRCTIDADWPASLLPGLELLLVRVVEFVHTLGERPMYDVVAACVSGSSVVEHGYDVV